MGIIFSFTYNIPTKIIENVRLSFITINFCMMILLLCKTKLLIIKRMKLLLIPLETIQLLTAVLLDYNSVFFSTYYLIRTFCAVKNYIMQISFTYVHMICAKQLK